MLKTILRIFAMAAVGFVGGILGMLIGALIGGNFAQEVVFNSVRGYEATGQIGLIAGALIGLAAGWRFLFRGG